MQLYHGSPYLFDKFSLAGIGTGTGIKYGFGVYLTESERTAVHYSQPRGMELAPEHYLYTVEIPDLTEDNHIVSARPVPESIIARLADLVGQRGIRHPPEEVAAKGKLYRKWLGTLVAGKDSGPLTVEKEAAHILQGIGVEYNVWPTAQTKPDGEKNIAVFNPELIRVVKVERIQIENRKGKWVLVGRKEVAR